MEIHLLHPNLDFFPENFATLSDNHGENLNQNISQFEKRYCGKPCPTMLVGCCWSLTCMTGIPNEEFAKKKK
jgi:hypothetical protein